MATYEQEHEIEPEAKETPPNTLDSTLAIKNIEHIQMCLYATLAATEAAMRMLLRPPS